MSAKLVLPVLLCLSGFAAHGQLIYPSTINVTGQFGTSRDFQVEISIGESTSITTLSSTSIVLTSGVLQTSVAVQPSINTSATFTDEIKVHPNPARDYLGISFLGKDVGRVKYQLYSQSGKLMLDKQFYYFGITSTERMNLQSFPPGVYFLAVQQYSSITNELTKKGTFPVIKVN